MSKEFLDDAEGEGIEGDVCPFQEGGDEALVLADQLLASPTQGA